MKRNLKRDIAEPASQPKDVAPAVRLSQIAGRLDQILAL
jgi:hypothetical protein